MNGVKTIKEIAAKANVSAATVSNVLNNRLDQVGSETRDKILSIIKETNFKPNRIAKSLRINRSHTIGVIAEDITVFNTPSIINGINRFAEQHQYRIILNDLGINRKLGLSFSEITRFRKEINGSLAVLLSFQVDGIIYVGLHPRDVTGILSPTQKPVLFVDCVAEEGVSVIYDDRSAFARATEALVDLGHHTIALIGGPPDSMAAESRLAGFKAALEDRGIPYDPELVVTGDWGFDSGYRIGKSLLDSERPPTAIIAMNDLMAIGAMNAAQDSGLRVPIDISVIGFDDIDFCKYTKPALTSVRLPLHEMGYTAANNLLSLIDTGEVAATTIELPCELMMRDSAGRCN